MNKLMFVAAGVAVAGSAFAVPTVYDYKASVKHVYLKELSVNVNQATVKVYAKTQKSASLKGYLIQDTDATLRTAAAATISGVDVQPKNRAFLVVRNSSAEKDFRVPRILPAVLEAKWYNTNVSQALKARAQLGTNLMSSSGTVTTEGYLYVGGEIVTALANGFDTDNVAVQVRALKLSNYGTETTTPTYAAGNLTYAIDDYNFTSCFLFGKFNQPDWSYTSYAANNDTPWVPFADAWMNGAGFGKGKWSATACCGRASAGWELTTLSGNLKAGLFLCSENGEYWDHTANLSLEEEYWEPDANRNSTVAYADNIDIWADGILDLGTTDVGYGTWQIKRNASFTGTALTDAERATVVTAWGHAGSTAANSLLGNIKGAANKLQSGTELFGNVMGSVSVATDAALINQAFWTNYLNY